MDVPGEEDSGGSGTTETPPTDTTTGSVPPNVTIGTSPMPVTTGSFETTTSDSGGWYLDVAMPESTTDTCEQWAVEGCGTSPRTNASVGGTTPLGDFEVAFAAFASDGGCSSCVDFPNVDRVYLVGTPADLSGFEPEVGLMLSISGYEGPVGTATVGFVSAYRDGTSDIDDATFVFDTLPDATDLAEPFDPLAPAYVTGSFTANNWDLSGTFAAVYCPEFNSFAICE